MIRWLAIVLAVTLVIFGTSVYSSKAVPSLEDLEQLAYHQVNEYRINQGLNPLQWDELISKQVRIHSQQMAEGISSFSHQGFEQRVEVIATQIPYSKAAENIAYNQGYDNPAQQAVKGWIASFGHQQNMVASFDLTGMGVAKNDQDIYYFTQIFILKR